MKYRQQFDSSDCGAACLVMIASYFGMSLNIAKTRLYACTDTSGTNFKGLITAAKIYNLKVRVVKGNISSITNKLYTPFIAHLNIVREDNNWVNHYVIVKKITTRYIDIWDPD